MSARPEVVIVRGHGLASVYERGEKDGRAYVATLDHGHPPGGGPGYRVSGRWWWADDVRILTPEEAVDALDREQADAGVRGVGCNHPGCWCVAARVRS